MKSSGLLKVIDLNSVRSTGRSPTGALRPSAPPGLSRRRRRIVAIGGGKGGIGKTLIAANLAIGIARRGHRVVIIDADLGGANLHTCLGVSQPTLTLSDFVEKRVGQLQDLAVPTGVERLSLIAGALDSLDAANVKHQQKLRLLRNLQSYNADYVFLDLGAGTHFNALDFFLLADHGIVVLLPEPTSIENAYRFVKAAFFRYLHNVKDRYGIAELVDAAINSRTDELKTPYDFVQRLRSRNPALADQLAEELRGFRVRIILNQARTPADRQVGNAAVAAWMKFFGLGMDYLGAIGYDDEAWRAIRKRRPLLLERPECEAAAALERIADNLLQFDNGGGRAG